jgi:site-specific recombinase XerC
MDAKSPQWILAASVSGILNETLRRLEEPTLERIRSSIDSRNGLESKSSITPATRKGYEQVVDAFLHYLGPNGRVRRLGSITEADVRGFVIDLKAAGVGGSTINNCVRKYLAVPFEKTRKLANIRYNPIAATDPEKTEVVRRGTFTPERVVALVTAAKAAQQNDWAGAILFAYGCGSRLQDIANFRWSSLDLEFEIVTFTETKTGRVANVGLHPDFVGWVGEGPVKALKERGIALALSS